MPQPFNARLPRVLHSVLAVALVAPALLAAQSPRTIRERADLLLTPGGRALATVNAGAVVQSHETRGAFTRVTLRGFVDAGFLGGARDSFASSIRGGSGTVRLRASASRSAAITAELFAGMGLTRATKSGSWADVARSGWIRSGALANASSAATAVSPAPPAATPEAAPAAVDVADAPIPAGTVLTPTRQIDLRSAPNGAALASARPGTNMTPLARERGWVRVRVEGWVPEKDLVSADSASRRSPSAADLRADPEGHRGQTVSWEVEILKLQFADPLRPSMAREEPYLLARGPGSEGAVIYLAVPPSLLATARSLPPLTRVSVTARVRNGRSEPVGVPILDLMRIVRL